MSIDLTVDIEGDLVTLMEQQIAQAAKAGTKGMRRAGTGLKTALRRQVRKAGMGNRLAKTWRHDNYPNRGIALEPAAYVYSKAPEIISSFSEGLTIKAKSGRWLAIPTDKAVSKDKRRKARPQDYKELQFIPSKQGNKAALLHQGVVVFYLVRSVRLRKLFDIDGASNRWHGKLPDIIIREWNKLDK